MIIMIGGVKGGTGKSTIATNLAVYLAVSDADVLLLDVDPQATAYKWAMRRRESHPELPIVHTAQASGRVFDVIRDMAKRYQHIIIDSGGHASDAMKSAMLATQKLYIPLRPSQADLETIGEMCAMIQDVKVFHPNLQALTLLTMVSTHPGVVEAIEAQEALKEVPGIGLSASIIHDRKIYRDALFEGMGVLELPLNKGVTEIQQLAKEIYGG